jgi:hypothetical protein
MSPKTKAAAEEVISNPVTPPVPTEGEAPKIPKERRKKKTAEAGAESQSEKKPAQRKKASPQAETKEAAEGEVGKDGKRNRTFTVVKVVRNGDKSDFKGGRYQSNSPSSAARKSANLACKEYGGDREEIDIYMQETTKDSAKKWYGYHAIRTKVEEKDVSFQTGGGTRVSVPFQYAITVKALPKDAVAAAEAEAKATAEPATAREVPPAEA